MKILVILAHPQEGSFNHAISRVTVETLIEKGHKVMFHDLYKEKFDPVLPGEEISKESEKVPTNIQMQCDELKNTDGIIIIHPNWWGQPPAILKGWIDRVIRPGVAYEFEDGDDGEGIPLGLLNAKVAIVFNTSNTSAERENNVFGDPLERIWKDCIFDLCGVKNFYRKMYRIVVTSSIEERKEWLEDVRNTLIKYI